MNHFSLKSYMVEKKRILDVNEYEIIRSLS